MAMTVFLLVKLKALLKERNNDWTLLEQDLDKLDWSEIEQRMSTSYREVRYDTYLPGRVLLMFDIPNAAEIRSVLTDGTFRNLRQPIISMRMLTDHSMEKYVANLSEKADIVPPPPLPIAPIEPIEGLLDEKEESSPPVSHRMPSAIEKLAGMQQEIIQALHKAYKFSE